MMKSFLTALAGTLCLADARLISRDNGTISPVASLQSNYTRYAILDNDWNPTAFIPYLLALGAGMEVLGLASNTANTWVGQTTLHGVSFGKCATRKSNMKHLTKDLAGNSRKGKPVLYTRGERRDIPSHTDLSTFPAMATTLGERRMTRSVCPGKFDCSVFGQRSHGQ